MDMVVCAASQGIVIQVFSPVNASPMVRLVAQFWRANASRSRPIGVLYDGGAHYDAVRVADGSGSGGRGRSEDAVSPGAGQARVEQQTVVTARKRRTIDSLEWERKAKESRACKGTLAKGRPGGGRGVVGGAGFQSR